VALSPTVHTSHRQCRVQVDNSLFEYLMVSLIFEILDPTVDPNISFPYIDNKYKTLLFIYMWYTSEVFDYGYIMDKYISIS